jgi:hypothetical protein
LELWSERKSQVALIRAEDEFKQVFLAVVDDLDDARAIGAQRLPKEVGRTARTERKAGIAVAAMHDDLHSLAISKVMVPYLRPV